ncbi:MAG: outer membrane protein assembly factor BamA [Rhodospirillales bacterium]
MGGKLNRVSALLLGLASCAMLVFSAAPLLAQSRLIEEVVIEGAQRVEPETVKSYMTVQPGDDVQSRRVDDSLKALFATGLFADVSFRLDGNRLVVTVVENPIINRIAFEGNRRIKDDVLETEVQLRPRVVYSRTKVQSDVERLLEIYRRSGRFAATVDPKVITLDQNRVDVAFEIDEGPLTTVSSIRFVGNKTFDDSDLRELVATKEEAWYRFLTTADTYDPDRLTFDRELLRRFYMSEGFADFRVLSAIAELTPDRQSFFITITVDEGPRYKFGTIDIVADLPKFDKSMIDPELLTPDDDWYNADIVEKTIEKLTDAVGTLGYAFVEIQPRIRRNKDELKIDITYEIQEGPKVFVERVNITGNFRTQDKVIRREVQLVEGDAFSSAKLRRSRQRIRNLGFFEKADVQHSPGSTEGQTVVDVEVSEQSTGELSLGAGFSTLDGPLVDIGIRERNLLGRGQDLRASVTIAAERSQVDLGFTEPYFLDRELAAGFDLFRIVRDRQTASSFDEKNTGGRLRAGYVLADDLTHSVNYTLEAKEISDLASDVSQFIARDAGTSYVSSVGHRLTYDKRDNRIKPKEGYVTRLSNDLAGLGGSVRYLRSVVEAQRYFNLNDDDLILETSLKGGYIFGIGDDVQVLDRFFVGGTDLRGFADSGISPRDILTDDALGAKWMYAGTVQLTFPLGLPSELGITARVFSDFGSNGGTDDSPASLVNDEASFRMAMGAGIGWESPLGPINVDIAVPVLDESYDKDELIRLSFGTRF